MFLKQKRDETSKGRMVDGGNKQRGIIDNEDATSPTAELESVLLTSAIDAAGERDVALIYIPNAFIQTSIQNDEDKIILCLKGNWPTF